MRYLGLDLTVAKLGMRRQANLNFNEISPKRSPCPSETIQKLVGPYKQKLITQSSRRAGLRLNAEKRSCEAYGTKLIGFIAAPRMHLQTSRNQGSRLARLH